MRRRRALTAAGGLVLAGCLRLTDDSGENGSDPAGDASTEDPSGSNEGVDPAEDSGDTVTVEHLRLVPERDLEITLYGGVFARDGSFCGVTDEGVATAASTGELEWRSEPLEEDDFPQLPESISFTEDTVFVGGLGSGRTALYAFDRTSGERRWRRPTDDGHELIRGIVADADVAVYVSRPRGSDGEAVVRALDHDGEERWTVTLDPPFVAPPVRYEDTLFVTTTERCYSMSWNEPSTFDRVEGAERVRAEMARDADAIYTAHDALVRLDPRTGDVDWTTDPDRELLNGSAPAAGNGVVVAGTETGYAVAVDAETGRLAWETRLDGSMTSTGSLQVHGDHVWAVDDSGECYALAVSDGEIRHQRTVRDDPGVHTSVGITNGRVLFDANRTLYRIDES